MQELAERKANVYATLKKLQEEVSQITKITEFLKDAENIKDSKTFVEEIKKEFGVRIYYTQQLKFVYVCKMLMILFLISTVSARMGRESLSHGKIFL